MMPSEGLFNQPHLAAALAGHGAELAGAGKDDFAGGELGVVGFHAPNHAWGRALVKLFPFGIAP